MTVTISAAISNRILAIEAAEVVAGNDYAMTVAYDSEWSGTVYVRVRFGPYHYDIPTTVSAGTVTVQMPIGYPEVGIGIFSEALEICTNEARVRVTKCILESGTEPVEFDDALYEQWTGEVTSLLVDDAFDATSGRPIANRVVAALDASALKKDVLTSQTVQGPLVLDKVADGRGSVVFGQYNANVNSGRYLRVASFARPSGNHSHVKIRLLDRASTHWIDFDLHLDASGSTPDGQVTATCNFTTRHEAVLAYNESSDYYAVYVNPKSGATWNVVSVLVEAVNQAGEAIALRPNQGMGNSASISTMHELGRVIPQDVSYNMRMTSASSAQSTYPVWNLLASASAGTVASTGMAGVFLLSSTNPDFAPVNGIIHVSQRTSANTGGAPLLSAVWLGCSPATQSEDVALVQRDGVVELWGKQRYRYQAWVVTVMTSWRNSSMSGGIWTIETGDESQADLPSGTGVYSVYSTLPGGSQAAMSLAAGLMGVLPDQTEGADVQPTGGGDGEDQR